MNKLTPHLTPGSPTKLRFANFDIDQAIKRLSVIHNDQIPFAASVALNKLAFQIAVGQGGKGELRNQVDRYLKGGAERFTKQGFQYVKSTKKNLQATIFAELAGTRTSVSGSKDPSSGGGGMKRRYLENIIEGGTVLPPDKPGRTNLLQPTKNTPRGAINKHGNIKPDAYAKYRANKDRYFYGFPAGKPKTDKFLGLYERVGVKRKKGGTKLKKIFTTGNKSRPIRRLFPARDIAYRYARQRIMFEFNKALKQAERTRRA
jgi:hypothetical protein